MGRSSGGGFRREVRCMRAFLDTNVILEFFLDREAGKTACQLFAKYRDIEDSCQFQAAKKAGCKVLIKKTNKGTARPMSSDAFLLRSTIMFFCPYYLKYVLLLLCLSFVLLSLLSPSRPKEKPGKTGISTNACQRTIR